MTQITNKKINWTLISIFIGLIGNFAVVIWGSATLASRVEDNTKRLDEMDALTKAQSNERQTDRELLVRMDERTKTMAINIDELKKAIK